MSQNAKGRLNRILVLATVTLGFFTNFFLYGIVVPMVPFLLRQHNAVPEHQIQYFSSALMISYIAAAAIFSVPVGWATDKIGSCQSLFVLDLALLLASTILFTWGTNVVVIIVARALQGISAAIVWTVGFAMVHNTVPPDQTGQAIGTVFSIATVGDIAAPIVGDFLYEESGIICIFGVSASLLCINLFMRLIMIDIPIHDRAFQPVAYDDHPAANGTAAASEITSLIPLARYNPYRILDDCPRWAPLFPILYCCSDPRLVMAFVLTFAKSFSLGMFSATIPTGPEAIFNFSSVPVGILFSLFVPYLLLGGVAGKAVDRFGTRIVATVTYGLLVPSLILLGLPSYQLPLFTSNVTHSCAFLALNWILMVFGSSTSLVEESDVMGKYEHSNPGLFSKSGPFAQIYSFDALFFFVGLTFGPCVGSLLRSAFGFDMMLISIAGFSAVVSALSFLLLRER